jgi:AraC-like DNA-binding protein
MRKTLVSHNGSATGPREALERKELVAYLAHQLPIIAYVELLRWESGRAVAAHAHAETYQIDFFSEGAGYYQLEEQTIRIERDTIFFIPPTMKHAIQSSADAPLLGMSVKCILPGLTRSLFPSVFSIQPSALPSAEALLRNVISEHIVNQGDRQLMARLRMAELLIFLANCLQPNPERRNGGVTESLLQLLHQRFREPLTLKELAEAVNISPPHLCRAVRRETGKTPFDILRQIRVERARQILSDGHTSVSEAARQSGFSSLQQMKRAFCLVTGMTSRDYRRQGMKTENISVDHKTRRKNE